MSISLLDYCKNNNIPLLDDWDYEKNTITPNEISYGSPTKVWWKCKCCGYSWLSAPNNRVRINSKCPKCKYKK